MDAHQMFKLRRLSELLRNLPDKKFYMSYWSQGPKCCDLNDCGTRACVAGWSTVFFEDLKLIEREDNITYLEYRNPSGEVSKEYRAIIQAWGISDDEAIELCSASIQYDSPSAAADELDKLIEKYFVGEGDEEYVHGVN